MTHTQRANDEEAINLFDQANAAWDGGELTRAFLLFKDAARNGEMYAFNTIGYFFEHGLGVEVNIAKAMHWYKKAAQCKDVCAYTNIGLLYLRGGNVRQARFWLKKAVDDGDGDAALQVAKLSMSSKTSRGRRVAVAYLESAINAKSVSNEGVREARSLLRQLSE